METREDGNCDRQGFIVKDSILPPLYSLSVLEWDRDVVPRRTSSMLDPLSSSPLVPV